MTTAEPLPRTAARIRLRILDVIMKAGKGHVGGAFSCTDILVALYHGRVLRVDPKWPAWPERDRFILSKGHAGIAHFAVLADMGFIDPVELLGVCHNGSMLGEHADHYVPGVETVTGSLGHGLGLAAGLALAAKMDGRDWRTFVVLGDGECHEGSVWESAMFAAHHRLAGLTAIVDRNQQITLDYTEDCLRLEPLAEKFSAFGWDVQEIDGHDSPELLTALHLRGSDADHRPRAIIAKTVKGKGISFMEGELKWHHGMPNREQAQLARRELESQLHQTHVCT